ncbi:MAG: alpha/beta hydrolase [Myxacorys chilensis ATA2-1-KO14]|nr:alpha/beta hydrolase [Myxacorys chilensis ATA2-1-KO14]
MSISTQQHIIATSHGSLAVEETGSGGIPVLLIHGNSFCRGVFRNQMQGQIAKKHRFIAFDLPGHGQSSNAADPKLSYTLPGLADAAIELLDELGIAEVIVLGWSLGGHIGMEMIPHFPGMRGLMICGAPPVSHDQMSQGFNASPHLSVAGKQDLFEAEINAFVEGIIGKSAEPFLRDAVARADGGFRKRLFESARAGEGVNQRLIVESSPVPLAVVNGGADRLVNLDYFDTIAYANLWEGRCHRLSGLGHAPFWEAQEEFTPVLERFLRDVETGRGTNSYKD